MAPSSGQACELLVVSYGEAVLRLEVVVHINANPVEILHFLTRLNFPGKRGEQNSQEIKPLL